MCSTSRKHSIMKNLNCSILKRMDTASIAACRAHKMKERINLCLQKLDLQKWCYALNGLNNCKQFDSTVICDTKCVPVEGVSRKRGAHKVHQEGSWQKATLAEMRFHFRRHLMAAQQKPIFRTCPHSRKQTFVSTLCTECTNQTNIFKKARNSWNLAAPSKEQLIFIHMQILLSRLNLVVVSLLINQVLYTSLYLFAQSYPLEPRCYLNP